MSIERGAPGVGTPGGADGVQQIEGIGGRIKSIASTLGIKPKGCYHSDLIAICDRIYSDSPLLADYRAGKVSRDDAISYIDLPTYRVTIAPKGAI